MSTLDKPRRLKPEVVEAAASTYYDEMVGRPPHELGWAGKSEAFKVNVRARMEVAIMAAIAKAVELDD